MDKRNSFTLRKATIMEVSTRTDQLKELIRVNNQFTKQSLLGSIHSDRNMTDYEILLRKKKQSMRKLQYETNKIREITELIDSADTELVASLDTGSRNASRTSRPKNTLPTQENSRSRASDRTGVPPLGNTKKFNRSLDFSEKGHSKKPSVVFDDLRIQESIAEIPEVHEASTSAVQKHPEGNPLQITEPSTIRSLVKPFNQMQKGVGHQTHQIPSGPSQPGPILRRGKPVLAQRPKPKLQVVLEATEPPETMESKVLLRILERKANFNDQPFQTGAESPTTATNRVKQDTATMKRQRTQLRRVEKITGALAKLQPEGSPDTDELKKARQQVVDENWLHELRQRKIELLGKIKATKNLVNNHKIRAAGAVMDGVKKDDIAKLHSLSQFKKIEVDLQILYRIAIHAAEDDELVIRSIEAELTEIKNLSSNLLFGGQSKTLGPIEKMEIKQQTARRYASRPVFDDEMLKNIKRAEKTEFQPKKLKLRHRTEASNHPSRKSRDSPANMLSEFTKVLTSPDKQLTAPSREDSPISPGLKMKDSPSKLTNGLSPEPADQPLDKRVDSPSRNSHIRFLDGRVILTKFEEPAALDISKPELDRKDNSVSHSDKQEGPGSKAIKRSATTQLRGILNHSNRRLNVGQAQTHLQRAQSLGSVSQGRPFSQSLQLPQILLPRKGVLTLGGKQEGNLSGDEVTKRINRSLSQLTNHLRPEIKVGASRPLVRGATSMDWSIAVHNQAQSSPRHTPLRLGLDVSHDDARGPLLPKQSIGELRKTVKQQILQNMPSEQALRATNLPTYVKFVKKRGNGSKSKGDPRYNKSLVMLKPSKYESSPDFKAVGTKPQPFEHPSGFLQLDPAYLINLNHIFRPAKQGSRGKLTASLETKYLGSKRYELDVSGQSGISIPPLDLELLQEQQATDCKQLLDTVVPWAEENYKHHLIERMKEKYEFLEANIARLNADHAYSTDETPAAAHYKERRRSNLVQTIAAKAVTCKKLMQELDPPMIDVYGNEEANLGNKHIKEMVRLIKEDDKLHQATSFDPKRYKSAAPEVIVFQELGIVSNQRLKDAKLRYVPGESDEWRRFKKKFNGSVRNLKRINKSVNNRLGKMEKPNTQLNTTHQEIDSFFGQKDLL